ncbi:MAG: haloacid dehalogenase [Chloroflexi bacterium]|nr:haloacid dehalogenase [Chloroflexota bacterium]
MADIAGIAVEIEARMAALNAARERALDDARQIVRLSANSIRAVHRGDFDTARRLGDEAGGLVAALRGALVAFPALHWSGYVQDAQKEYTEARLFYAIIAGERLPTPEALGVEDAAYLNGMGETVGEIRRHVLDIIREGRLERGEQMLAVMDDIYNLLISIDYPDAITGSLRRTTDSVRGILERTRGDLTITLRQAALEQALRGRA